MKNRTRQVPRQICVRAIAFIIIFAMALSIATVTPKNVFAESSNSQEDYPNNITNDLKVSGENSFGDLLAETIDNYNDGGNEQTNYYITDLEMSNKTATVTYNAAEDCSLIVAVYSDDGTKMYASGSVKVKSEETSADVTIKIDTMPKYYLVKAFLLDDESHSPLCKSYVNELYTEAIQDIKSKDIYDFADSEVLNLDQNTDTNFAVYSNNVEVISSDSKANIYDEKASSAGEGIHIFNNANSELTSLKVGDIFTQKNGDDIIIIKIASIKSEKQSDGTYKVTITENGDLALEDVFDYVKIENNGKIDSYTIDDSTADKGVTDITARNAIAPILNAEGSKDLVSMKKNIKAKNDNIELNVDLKLNIKMDITVYASFKNCYIDLTIDTNATLNGEVTGKLSKDIKLPSVSAKFAGGVASVGLTPTLKFSSTAKMTIDAAFAYKVGFNCSTQNGLVNTSDPKPTLKFNVEVEGDLYFGIEFSPTVTLIEARTSKKVHFLAKLEVPIEVGLKITGKYTNQSDHTCKTCIDGDFNFVIKLNPTVKFFSRDGYSKADKYVHTAKLLDKSYKVGDWYYSADHKELGMGECSYSKLSGKCGDNLTWKLDTSTGVLTISGDGDMYNYDEYLSDSIAYNTPWIENANSIKEIKFNGKVTSIGNNAFNRCEKLENITLPNSVTSIGDGSFGASLSLKEINIPESVTTIGTRAFAGSGVRNIDVPNSVKSIGALAFAGLDNCSITLPHSITSIGVALFYEAVQITVKIPDSIESIHATAFDGWHLSLEIYYEGSQKQWENIQIIENVDNDEWPYGSSISNFQKIISLAKMHYNSSDVASKTYSAITSAQPNNVSPSDVSSSDILLNAVQSGNAVSSVPVSGAAVSTAQTTLQTVSFKNLTSDSEYLFVVLKSDEADDLFGSDNLLYIDQTAADSSGELKFQYNVKSSQETSVVKLYGSDGSVNTSSGDTPSPKITTQPADIVAKNNAWITFTLEANGDGLTYQWQLSDDQGKTWRNSSIKTSNYSTTLTTINDGRYVRCIVTDKYGISVTSNSAYMKITSLNITTQPTNATVKNGATASFKVVAAGEGLTYQWQLSDDQGKTWRNSSVKTANYSTTLTTTNDGRYVRCIVTDKYGISVTSNSAYMKITTLNITTQPTNATVKNGATASFKVVATGEGLTYQWQLSDDQGMTWRNSSVKTANYSATVSSTNNGRYVRCIVTDKYGNSVKSGTAIMNLTTLNITTQPTNATVKNGATASFKVAATGVVLTYQWQLSDDQGKTWRNSSVKTATYYATVTDTNNGRYVRCIVTDKYGNSVTSNSAYMKITNLNITTQPTNATVKNGTTASFKVVATGEGLTYQWQLSDDQGKTWRNSSVKTATYYATVTDTNNGRYVRCIVTDKYGNSVKSGAAIMKLTTLNITTQPTNAMVKNGATASFKVVATGEGLTYQWQLSDDQGKTWRNSSVKTATYSVTVTGTNNGRYVRCIVTDKYGNSVTSNSAYMKLK